MEELILAVPGMWADHHVLAVRDLLRAGRRPSPSSRRAPSTRTVRVDVRPRPHRPAAHRRAARRGRLRTAGAAEDAATPPTDKPAWATAGVRVTTTNAVDLAMSGDHRKY